MTGKVLLWPSSVSRHRPSRRDCGDVRCGANVSTGTQLHRVQINARGLPQGRESLLLELKQRVREVREGPDGALYLLTDHDDGALLVVEPGEAR